MTDVILQCTGIVKEFPGLRALDEVAFELQLGEVHALVGQNGAGKSTLVKILTGVYTLDAGEIVLEGEPIEIRSPTDAEAHGIAIVHQDQHLVPQFDVTRNVFLGRELTTAGGLLDFDAMRKATTASLERIGADFSPDHLANDLSVGQREQVAIAAALLQEPRVLILDEPTASLSEREIDRLFEVIENLRNSGVSIIYISHHLNEVFRISSRITVLRDGKVAGQLNTRDTDRESIVRLTVGRDLKSLYPKEPVEAGDELLAVENISDGHRFEGVSFRVRRGEIYGLAGLVGAGRTEIALSIMGAGRLRGGSVKLSGKPVHNASPARARDHGFALIPEDRRGEGLIGPLSIRKNMAIPNLSWWSNLGLMSLRKEAERVAQLMARLSIAATSSEQAAETLSGGNQQKVVIGKWLDGQSEVFLFDEPTTGVDVGAKVEIYKEMIELARAGAAVVFISSDLEELVGMCDRVGVVAKGRLEKEIPREDLDLQTLLFWTTAGTRASGPTAAGQAADPGSGTDATPQKAVAGAGGRAEFRTGLSPTRFLIRWGTSLGMILSILAMGIGAPDFFRPSNLLEILKQGSILTLIGYGQTLVLIAGGFDMSAGALAQLTSNLAAGVVGRVGTALSFAFGGVVGVVVGFINAFLVIVFRMPPFIATLGMMFVLTGGMLAYNGGQALTLHDLPGFFFIGQGYLGPVPFVVVLLGLILALLHIVLKRTRPGLRMYAVGESLPAARLRGISQARSLVYGFVGAGLLVGLTGVLQTSYSYGATAVPTGLDFMISALAAAFLGSTFSRTGELDVVGTTIAAMFITSLSNGLILNGVSNLALPAIQGGILVVSVLLSVIQKRDIGQINIF